VAAWPKGIALAEYALKPVLAKLSLEEVKAGRCRLTLSNPR